MLTISVDGVVPAQRVIPVDLAMRDDVPLRIGGKSVGPENDQFRGELDDVFLSTDERVDTSPSQS
ncbi:MAG: hypothetical protein AUI14_07345 [Actinobacteria bacterium 13_2_20CM_2_71_6]|nr:MAG: hypothetical protein AUI14_07345 [Actinobacteria bacterium 13_2_20CM_2_71_6]